MSAAIGGIASNLIGGLVGGPLIKSVFGKKKKEAPRIAPRIVTNSESRLAAEQRDRLSSRTGTQANRRVGFGAGEAMSGPKTSVLGRTAS